MTRLRWRSTSSRAENGWRQSCGNALIQDLRRSRSRV